MVNSDHSDGTFRPNGRSPGNFGKKGVSEYKEFLEVRKSIFEGIRRFADNHFMIFNRIMNVYQMRLAYFK